MEFYFFITLLFSLQLFYWFIGRRASKNVNSQEDYFLAGKSVRFFPLMMTFLATQVGGGVVLGSADEAFRYGWAVALYPLGIALGLILLGCGVGRKLAELQLTTVAEIFEVVYRSVLLRRVAGLLSVVSLFMIFVAQIIASSKFLISLGFDNTPLFIAFWACVIIYTAQGGLKAVISTDMMQAGFFTIVFFCCFAFSLLSEGAYSFAVPTMENFSNVSPKLCGWLLMPLLFMVIEQDMGQRIFAGASTKTVSRATICAGVMTMLVCVVPIFFGLLARAQEVVPPEKGSVLMTMIAKTTGPWMTAIVACAILAAIISTATSLISAISSNLSSDFNLSISNLRIIKIVTGSLSTAAIFFALFLDNIVDLLIQSYELSVSCLFIPIIFALFKREGSFLSALLAILFGVMGFFLFRIYPTMFPREILSIALSLAGYGIGAFAENLIKQKERLTLTLRDSLLLRYLLKSKGF